MQQYISQKREAPEVLAERAYRDGFFIEAIQILHAYLENQAQELLMLVGSVHFNSSLQETWDLAETFSFHDCLNALFILNQITKTEFDEFREVNTLRNKVVHQIFKEPYEKKHLGVSKMEYDKIFHRTLEQIDFFSQKNADIIE